MAANLTKKFGKGITFVELLVAISISIIVITIAINIYISFKKNYINAKSKAEIDIKELTAKKIFYDAIVNAGLSCKYGSKNQSYTNRTGDNSLGFDFLYNNSSIRVGNISFITSYLQDSLGNSQGILYQSNTDYIMVKAEQSFTDLASKLINLNLSLEKPQQWNVGDYLALCNNDNIDIVKLAGINKNNKQIHLAIAPSSEYYKSDYIGKYSVQIFYIAAKYNPYNSSKLSYSLYMYLKDGSRKGVSYPLIKGVSDLKINYSVLNRKNLSWRKIFKNIDLDDTNGKAIKISFKIKNKYFEKIILL